MDKAAHRAWVASLKPGDDVAVRHGGNKWSASTVKEIGPRSIFLLADPHAFSKRTGCQTNAKAFVQRLKLFPPDNPDAVAFMLAKRAETLGHWVQWCRDPSILDVIELALKSRN